MTAETGTYRWMAPEVIAHQYYDEKADVFSYGVMVWELVSGGEVLYPGYTPASGRRWHRPARTTTDHLPIRSSCYGTSHAVLLERGSGRATIHGTNHHPPQEHRRSSSAGG